MAKDFLATGTAVTVVYITGLITLACVGIWDITNIIADYRQGNRITTVVPINITGSFPHMLSNVKVCFNYPGRAVYPKRLTRDEAVPILRAGWTGQRMRFDGTLGNASAWEETFLAAIPHFYMYYVIGDVDRSVPDTGFSNSTRRRVINENFVTSTGLSKTELHSILDRYINSPEKLLQMKQSLDILQFYLGGVIPINQAADSATEEPLYEAITTDSSPVAEEGCFRIHLSKFLTPENARVRYAYILSTDDTKPYMPPVSFYFPERLTLGLRSETGVTIAVSNIAIIDFSSFPPCAMDYQTEEDCLEDSAVRIIVDVCKCAPLTRIARGSIDVLSPAKTFARRQYITNTGKRPRQKSRGNKQK